jgi:acetyl-CoA acetyltransferase family protein
VGTDVFVLDTIRTPLGRHGGGLAGVRPDDLAAHVLRALVERNPDLDPASIDDVVMGNGNGAGEENRNVARMAALLAGIDRPGVTVNRLCGSGLEAVIQARRAIAVGDAGLCVAGGVESMSRAPWVVMKPERGFVRADAAMASTTLGWRLVNPAMPAGYTVSLGEGAEILAQEGGIDRERQDEFALRSHRRAHAGWESGVLAEEVAPVPDTKLERDEGVRADADLEALAKLRPAFRSENGTVTAGNASQLSDGAAALLLGDGRVGPAPLARIAASAVHAVDPPHYGIAPVAAAERALAKAGIGWGDVAVVELNEAFAAQALACLDAWPELDPDKVNPYGGAIALGHPIGCSGARILATLARELRRRGGGWGLAAICIGVGQGLAVVLEG